MSKTPKMGVRQVKKNVLNLKGNSKKNDSWDYLGVMGSLGTCRGKKINNYEVLFLFLCVHENLKYLYVYTNTKNTRV